MKTICGCEDMYKGVNEQHSINSFRFFEFEGSLFIVMPQNNGTMVRGTKKERTTHSDNQKCYLFHQVCYFGLF